MVLRTECYFASEPTAKLVFLMLESVKIVIQASQLSSRPNDAHRQHNSWKLARYSEITARPMLLA